MFSVGLGFDSHAFEDGKALYLGGVRIDYPKGLKGHSDADVLLHAITDAILSALGEPDIGELFPDTDPRYRDAPSVIFLEEALRRMREKKYSILNVDCTLIADEPRIKNYKPSIRQNLARLLGVDYERVNVKGKRREGFCEGVGIACFCVVLLKHGA